jgi:hypothetical protein
MTVLAGEFATLVEAEAQAKRQAAARHVPHVVLLNERRGLYWVCRATLAGLATSRIVREVRP